MRVISGLLKGRKIEGYDIEGTRPTMDRVKESVFGSIQNYIKESVVLDLFAGSGNLGIEAISNGSNFCYFVDNNNKCIDVINKNINNFNIRDKAKTLYMDYGKAIKYFNINNILFDIIFIDPPYDYNNINKCIRKILEYNILNKNGLLILEFRDDKLDIDENTFIVNKKKKYGDKFIYILQKNN